MVFSVPTEGSEDLSELKTGPSSVCSQAGEKDVVKKERSHSQSKHDNTLQESYQLDIEKHHLGTERYQLDTEKHQLETEKQQLALRVEKLERELTKLHQQSASHKQLGMHM